MKVEIIFNALGYIKQRVEITHPDWTPAKLQKALEAHEVFTTVQNGGDVEIVESGEVIGKVVSVDNELEYEEFDVTEWK